MLASLGLVRVQIGTALTACLAHGHGLDARSKHRALLMHIPMLSQAQLGLDRKLLRPSPRGCQTALIITDGGG